MVVNALPIPPQPADSCFDTPEYKACSARLKEVRNAAAPDHWSKNFEWKMAAAHTLYFSLLERVYMFAQHAVDNDDVANYLGFADVAFAQISTHHHFEESEIFPFWDEHASDEFKGRLEVNVEQHGKFVDGIDACWLYVRECRAQLPKVPPTPVPLPQGHDLAKADLAKYHLDPSRPFDPQVLRQSMNQWIPACAIHMTEELGTLTTGLFNSMGEKRYLESEKLLEAHLKAENPFWSLPSSMASVPMQTVKDVMGLPYPVRRVLVPFVFSGRYWGFWKYTEYPENLTFAGTA